MTLNEVQGLFGKHAKGFYALLKKELPNVAYGGPRGISAQRRIIDYAEMMQVPMKSAARKYLLEAVTTTARKAQVNALRRMKYDETEGIMFGGVNERVTRLILADAYSDIADGVKGVSRLAKRTIKEATVLASKDKQISEAIAEGLLSTETRREISKRVLVKCGFTKADRIIYSNGRTYEAGYYMEMVTRTRLMEAANRTTEAMLKEDGQEYFYIPEHGDSCETCAVIQGKVWAFEKGSTLGIPAYPKDLISLPPVHPHCTHTVAPWVARLQTPQEIKAAIAAHSNDAAELGKIKKLLR